MPTVYIDNLSKRDTRKKKLQPVTEEQVTQSGFHVDIQDPRNENHLDKLLELKNLQLTDFLRKDAMMPYQDVYSARQRLLKLRCLNKEL